MPRYYFDFSDGDEFVEDFEGVLLPDTQAIHAHALAAAEDVLRTRFARPGTSWIEWSVRVRDEAGNELLVLPLSEVKRGSG